MSTDIGEIRAGYQWCRNLARTHYENFPVASFLLPKNLRDPVAAIYAFARSADDIADEGNLEPAQRIDGLNEMSTALQDIENHAAFSAPLYAALADTIHRHGLPLQPFRDLLSAFRQDVSKTRYADFGEVMDYCRRSANPVGRLMLSLSGQSNERNLGLSDAICSALQLINFLQDIGQDFQENRRIYLPVDEMERFHISEAHIAARESSPQMRALIQFQVQRATALLRSGSPLGAGMKGRFGVELRAIILGGSRIAEKIHDQKDLFSRPRLNRKDQLTILWRALTQGHH